MDGSDQTGTWTFGRASDGPDHPDRPNRPMAGLIALALVPVLAVLAFAAVMLARGGPPEPAPQAAPTTPGEVVPYPQTIATLSPPPGSSLPAIPPVSQPASAAPGLPGVPGGPGVGGPPGAGSSTGGGGSGGGGSGGGGGGIGGGGGGGTTTTQPPPPPPPPPGPTITSYGCGTSGGGISCTVRYSATGSVQIRWVKDGDAMTAWNDRATISGGCVAGEPTFVTVTVTDVNGSASGWDSVRCPGVPK
jgi:hypothetical protein